MSTAFYKYQGTGNDFIMIDDRSQTFPISEQYIAKLCNRRFGIGADGLILIQNCDDADFRMVYFNSDGKQSTMCGNGGRCSIRFAKDIGLIGKKTKFIAIDGLHEGYIQEEGRIHLKMVNTGLPVERNGGWFVDTGSPHHIAKVEEIEQVEVKNLGRDKRNDYGTEGANVNFVEVENRGLTVRTYERGVEDETFSCGTGVTAAAIIAHYKGWLASESIPIKTPGGQLEVKLKKGAAGYEEIWLIGPATFVFHGEINL